MINRIFFKGWTNNSRKVIIMATDDAFHIAGDGKVFENIN